MALACTVAIGYQFIKPRGFTVVRNWEAVGPIELPAVEEQVLDVKKTNYSVSLIVLAAKEDRVVVDGKIIHIARL